MKNMKDSNTSGHAEPMASGKGGSVDGKMWGVKNTENNNDAMPSNSKGKVEKCSYDMPMGNG